MSVTVKVELESTTLVHQQSIDCKVILQNNSRGVLHDINPENLAGGPTMILTGVDDGKSERFSTPNKPGAMRNPVDVRYGQTRDHIFFLTQLVAFPGPGSYDLQAEYVWDNGAKTVRSEPLRVEILPNDLRPHAVFTATGGASTTYMAACDRPSPNHDGEYELWLALINTSKRPRVHNVKKLERVSGRIAPVISIPPNTNPVAQWIAWILDDKLGFVAHKAGRVGTPNTTGLEPGEWQIVPPVLENPPRRGETMSTADVLLYHRPPESPGGALRMARIDMNGASMGKTSVALDGPAPAWWETASTKSLRRSTFLATIAGSDTKLAVSQWAVLGAPVDPQPLATLPGRCIGGGLWVTSEDKIVGAVVNETAVVKQRNYTFHTWSMSPRGEFERGPDVKINSPDDARFSRARVSVNIGQSPFALLEDTKGAWHYAAADGSLKPLGDTVGPGNIPLKILFRREVDPTIMYLRPGWGLDFVKP